MTRPSWIPELGDFIDTASVVLGAPRDAISRLPNLRLADSAINAPFAEFGGVQAHEGTINQAAVLIARLAQNHPLPDGNKRAAFQLTARFLDANGFVWGEPDIEADAGMVERIAASSASHDEIVAWIELRTTKSS